MLTVVDSFFLILSIIIRTWKLLEAKWRFINGERIFQFFFIFSFNHLFITDMPLFKINLNKTHPVCGLEQAKSLHQFGLRV